MEAGHLERRATAAVVLPVHPAAPSPIWKSWFSSPVSASLHLLAPGSVAQADASGHRLGRRMSCRSLRSCFWTGAHELRKRAQALRPDETGTCSVRAVRQISASYGQAALIRAVVPGRCRAGRCCYAQRGAVPQLHPMALTAGARSYAYLISSGLCPLASANLRRKRKIWAFA